MRILEVAPLAAPIDERATRLGGVQVLVQDLIRGLIARGHEITLAAGPGSHLQDVRVADLAVDLSGLQRAKLEKTDKPRPDDAAQRAGFDAVRRWLDDHRGEIDVVHAHAYDAPAFDALAGAEVPVVHTIHLPPLDLLVVEAARRARGSTLTTVSEANARSWRAAGVRIDRVVPNGIDVEDVPLGRSRGDHLIFAGRMSPEKGAATAIQVAEMTRRGILLVGDVYDEAYFAREIAPRVRTVADAGRLDRVRGAIYIGPRVRLEVYELLSRAAVSVMPVEWDEPFGLVALESLAAGTPVVAYARGGLTDVVDDACGALISPGDLTAFARAVDRVASIDPAECRRKAARFSIEAMVSEYETLLADLVHQAISSGGTDGRSR